MLDDLRNSAGSSFYEEDPLDTKPEKPERRRTGETRTAAKQRGKLFGYDRPAAFYHLFIPVLNGGHIGNFYPHRFSKGFAANLIFCD